MSPVGDAVDHEARAKIGLLEVRQDGHERVCAERYQNIAEALKRLEESGEQRRESIKGIYDRLSVERAALILLLLGVIGFLFVKVYG